MELQNPTFHKNNNNVLLAIVLLLLLLNIFFATGLFLEFKQVEALKTEVKAHQTNAKVLDFLNLFVDKVLESNSEVSFEDRLKLENAIRNINDPDLLAKWESFTSSSNEVQIQQQVKDLLKALIKKISY